MIDPEIGEKVTIDGITYECAEPQQKGWMMEECDLWWKRTKGCIGCEDQDQRNAHYREDGKHIILKRTSK